MWNKSLKLGKISGIPIYVHWSFSLVILYFVYIGIEDQLGTYGILWLLTLVLTLFGCVLLHELGHSMAARRYGIDTEDITLLPIGGLARLKEMPREPVQELVVAIMGPMVNVVIAIVLAIVFFLLFQGNNEGELAPYTSKTFVFQLMAANIILVIFNLIPAFPMDGGRIFRALLSMRLSYVKATQIASVVGRVVALIFVGIGFYWDQTMLMFVGMFVFFAANSENRMVSLEGSLEGHKIADLLRRRYTILRTHDTVGDALSLLFKGLERNFLIMDENNSLEGIVTARQLLDNSKTGLDKKLGDLMRTDIAALTTEHDLKEAYGLMRQKRQPIVPIFEGGLLMGVLDDRTINDFVGMRPR